MVMPPALEITSIRVELPRNSIRPGLVNSPRTVTFLLLYSA